MEQDTAFENYLSQLDIDISALDRKKNNEFGIEVKKRCIDRASPSPGNDDNRYQQNKFKNYNNYQLNNILVSSTIEKENEGKKFMEASYIDNHISQQSLLSDCNQISMVEDELQSKNWKFKNFLQLKNNNVDKRKHMRKEGSIKYISKVSDYLFQNFEMGNISHVENSGSRKNLGVYGKPHDNFSSLTIGLEMRDVQEKQRSISSIGGGSVFTNRQNIFPLTKIDGQSTVLENEIERKIKQMQQQHVKSIHAMEKNIDKQISKPPMKKNSNLMKILHPQIHYQYREEREIQKQKEFNKYMDFYDVSQRALHDKSEQFHSNYQKIQRNPCINGYYTLQLSPSSPKRNFYDNKNYKTKAVKDLPENKDFSSQQKEINHQDLNNVEQLLEEEEKKIQKIYHLCEPDKYQYHQQLYKQGQQLDQKNKSIDQSKLQKKIQINPRNQASLDPNYAKNKYKQFLPAYQQKNVEQQDFPNFLLESDATVNKKMSFLLNRVDYNTKLIQYINEVGKFKKTKISENKAKES